MTEDPPFIAGTKAAKRWPEYAGYNIYRITGTNQHCPCITCTGKTINQPLFSMPKPTAMLEFRFCEKALAG
jgi:hypothetical protein